jgi:hypothetical protein
MSGYLLDLVDDLGDFLVLVSSSSVSSSFGRDGRDTEGSFSAFAGSALGVGGGGAGAGAGFGFGSGLEALAVSAFGSGSAGAGSGFTFGVGAGLNLGGMSSPFFT